jgi:hypothetical protein
VAVIFSFALNVPTEIHSSTIKSGTVRSGLTASDQLNIPDQHRGEVMGKLAASNLMEEKLFPSNEEHRHLCRIIF